ncbi:serine acetyltransferase [Streptomyces asoensis]|uniref:Serine acetyltransferase n=1 Tax=Streptomyces asoensis TaxID=249586 RepID=A0A6M4XC36_9ACTN|nr:serine O-acetyltransferase EpsC [Streptomyces asoensis]QJT05653.1 serine acetyltransferase [Streptomyces asoensis]
MSPARTSPSLRRRIGETLDVIVARDPSVRSRTEALLHPTVLALLGHRTSNFAYRHGRRLVARLVCTTTKVLTGGIEIHPGAQIGRRFFVDHGSGVVVGETAVIGDDVSLFHQVTLGSFGWWHEQERARQGGRRHPRLGNGVTVGAGATLLGPITVGDDALIGAMSLVLRDVPKGVHVNAPRATIEQLPESPAAVGELPGTATADQVPADRLPALTPTEGPRTDARPSHRNGSERTHES